MNCNRCGNIETQGSSFCGVCGEDLSANNPDTQFSEQRQSGVSRDEELFISKNITHYSQATNKFRTTNSKINWNWSAFFAGMVLIIYRKMYLEFVIVYAATFIVGQITDSFLIVLAITFCFGLFFDYFYMKSMDRKLMNISASSDPLMKDELIAKKGGTSVKGVVIYCTIMMVLLIALITLFVFVFINMM